MRKFPTLLAFLSGHDEATDDAALLISMGYSRTACEVLLNAILPAGVQ